VIDSDFIEELKAIPLVELDPEEFVYEDELRRARGIYFGRCDAVWF